MTQSEGDRQKCSLLRLVQTHGSHVDRLPPIVLHQTMPTDRKSYLYHSQRETDRGSLLHVLYITDIHDVDRRARMVLRVDTGQVIVFLLHQFRGPQDRQTVGSHSYVTLYRHTRQIGVTHVRSSACQHRSESLPG